jgi:hypothetical protein
MQRDKMVAFPAEARRAMPISPVASLTDEESGQANAPFFAAAIET